MSGPDDIIELIDGTVADYTASLDAMRYVPPRRRREDTPGRGRAAPRATDPAPERERLRFATSRPPVFEIGPGDRLRVYSSDRELMWEGTVVAVDRDGIHGELPAEATNDLLAAGATIGFRIGSPVATITLPR